MMSARQLQQALAAARNRAKRDAQEIAEVLADMTGAQTLNGEQMQELRDAAEDLLQRVHEFSTYSNLISTN